jgi:hypothetical protein
VYSASQIKEQLTQVRQESILGKSLASSERKVVISIWK